MSDTKINVVTSPNTLAGSKALQTDSSGNPQESAVTTTELGYVSGVTSSLSGNSQAATLSNKTVQAANGTAGAPSISFVNQTDSGLYYAGTEELGVSVNGVQAMDFIKSTGGGNFGNVGMGGGASVSDQYPLLIQRSSSTPINAQISNPSTAAGAGAKVQIVADSGGNTMEVAVFTAATSSPDIYNGGRGVIRATGALTGVSIIADSTSGSDVKIYAGGDAIANRIATVDSTGITVGVAGSLTGALKLTGVTSGTITIKPQSAAGTYEFDLPTTAGSSGDLLTSAGGAGSPMTWTSTVAIAKGGTGQTTANAALNALLPAQGSANGLYLKSNGTNSSWAAASAPTAPTIQVLSSTGTQTGWLFTISTSSTCAVGDTYTNNATTYTVQSALSAQSGQVLFMSGVGSPNSGAALVRSAGAGTSNITFSANVATATYTTPSGPSPLYLRVTAIAGGAGGSGSGTAAGTSATAGGKTWFGPNMFACGAGQAASFGTTGGSISSIAPGSGFTLLVNAKGGSGQGGGSSTSSANIIPGGAGGATIYPPNAGNFTGAANNYGCGGAGANITGAAGPATAGSGGGAGQTIIGIITSIAATYPYLIGANGTGGGAGTGGSAGGDGHAGVVIVEEFYQ